MIVWQHALREVQRRPGRELLSLLSVVISVAAVIAVSSATESTRRAYQQVFQNLTGRADLEIVAASGGHFSQRVQAELMTLPGIEAVVPVMHRGTIVYAHDQKAKVVALGIVPGDAQATSGIKLLAGRMPKAAGETAIQSDLSKALELTVGDGVRLLTSAGLRRYRITGVVEPESAARLRQGGMLVIPLANLQRDFHASGEIDSLQLQLTSSSAPHEVESAIARRLPEGLRVQRPSARSGLAEETLLLTEVSLEMASTLSLTTALFIVLSIFLMSVGERRREHSIMRALGASRVQLVRIICAEALLVGLAGTVLGVPLGMLCSRYLATAMARLLQINVLDVPAPAWGLVVGSIAGPVICLLAAAYPAFKVSRVSPMEGLRQAESVEAARASRWPAIVGLVGLVVSSLLSLASVRGALPVWAAVAGLVLSMVSLVMLIPFVFQLAVGAFSYPVRWLLGLEGEISERVLLRRIVRSALTAGVLFVAMSSAVGTSNAAFSISRDVSTWYERTITGDYLLRPMMPEMTGEEGAHMDEKLGVEIKRLPQVALVDGVRLARVAIGQNEAMLMARDYDLYDEAPLDVVEGDPADVGRQLQQGAIVVGSVLAEKAKIHVGDTLHVTLGEKSQPFRVAAITTEYTFGGAIASVDRDVAKRVFQLDGVDTFLIKARADEAPQLAAPLEALAKREGLLLQSFVELQQLIQSMVNGVTGGLWVLLGLGLAVGGLGVVNTLMMNVLEQTRELGMLRAMGMARGGIVKTVIGQAAYLALVGILFGLVSGISLAYSLNLCLASMFGRHVTFYLDPLFLSTLVILSFAVVLLASLLPARRAAALSPIQAIQE